MSRKGGLRARSSDGSYDHLFKGKWNHGKTRTIRIPVVFAEELLEIARALDNGYDIEIKEQSEPLPEDSSIDLSQGQQDARLKEEVLDILNKIKGKETGYKRNGFSQGIKALKALEEKGLLDDTKQ